MITASVFGGDDEPEEIVEGVRHEWRRKGGNKLEVSELRCLETAPAMVLFNISNKGNRHAIRAEAIRLMKWTARHEKDIEMGVDNGGEVSVLDISLQQTQCYSYQVQRGRS